MDKLLEEYVNLRDKIFCQEIEIGHLKQFSDRVKSQLSPAQQCAERNAFKVVSLLSEMSVHNQSVTEGAAPSPDAARVFDLKLSLNQLSNLKRLIQKLDEPEKILTSLDLIVALFCKPSSSQINSHHQPSGFFLNCKTISELMFLYKKLLKLDNEEYQIKSLQQIKTFLHYGKSNNSTLIADHFENHSINQLVIFHANENKQPNLEVQKIAQEILHKYLQ